MKSSRRAKTNLLRWDRKREALKVGRGRTSAARLGVQLLSVVTSLLLGWQLAHYVAVARSAMPGPLPLRPPGVEGYLPISGLMGAVDWVYQGRLNSVHPAATILLLIFILMSLLIRKAFCGWICPVGFLSENLARLGRLLFKRNFRLPKGVDYPLRSLKYLLLGFFVGAVVMMTPEQLGGFIASPYNKVSDVKMLLFFARLSILGITVLAVLALASLFVNGFWCRYLCPYGALLGLVSWLSPVKVRRDPVTCTDCGACDVACPAQLPVARKTTIHSVECIGCGDCVTSCPVPTALGIGTRRTWLSPRALAALVLGLFLAGYAAARIAGVWRSGVSDAEMRRHISQMDAPEYSHPSF